MKRNINMQLLLSLGLIIAVACTVRAEPDIKIASDDWGDGRPSDIRALLRSVAEQFEPHFRGLPWPDILVFHNKELPITLTQRDADGRVQIGLSTRNRRWAQYSFQFSHELVHLIIGHLTGEKRWITTLNPVGWLEESLCEAGSLFALRAMSRDWETRAPFFNWVQYRQNLWNYAQDRLDLPEHNLPKGQTFSEWLKLHEAQLRSNCCNRQANSIVARQMLPVFEKYPAGWKSVAYLRASGAGPEAPLDAHLRGWHDACPEELQLFVGDLGEALGVSLLHSRNKSHEK
jgi:hypothetical protein